MEKKLEKYIQTVEKRLYDIFPPENIPQGKVVKAVKYSLSAGGKRLRPVLTLMFCEMCGGEPQKALDAACAVEYMHTYSLIHDDLPCMDDDDMRRGKPSCHKAFGETTAVLAGDALAILPFEMIASSRDIPPAAAVKCITILSHFCGINGMIGGQQIDTDTESAPADGETILAMYSMKTSALIKAACLCGVYCSGTRRKDFFAQKAAEYAEYLGLAFQITDDIRDVTSTDEVLGKPVGSDERSDKNTYVRAYGLDGAEKAAAEYTAKALDALSAFDNNEFAVWLTEKLLKRKK